MNNCPELRFYKTKDLFVIYKELSSYGLINAHLNWIKEGGRPVFDGIISDGLFTCIRNIFAHYPLLDRWDDVYINKGLATWNKSGSINQFYLIVVWLTQRTTYNNFHLLRTSILTLKK